MTRANKLKAGIIVVAALAAGAVSVRLVTQRRPPPPLTLVFERYSAMTDVFVHDVAFLWLTNSSDQIYYLPMTGGTNTLVPDTMMGLGRHQQPPGQSYLVRCEFSGQTPVDTSILLLQSGACLDVAPHSAVRLRVAVPPPGRKRRVAVLCIELPPGTRPFWTSRIGRGLLRVLPRSAAIALMHRQPDVWRVWCDREI